MSGFDFTVIYAIIEFKLREEGGSFKRCCAGGKTLLIRPVSQTGLYGRECEEEGQIIHIGPGRAGEQ
jgi:hypothetical protein